MSIAFAFDFTRLEQLSVKDSKDLVTTALKLSEECGEVAEAVLSFRNSDYKKLDRNDILEECCDAAMVALSIPIKMGIDMDTISKMFNTKLRKWKEQLTKE